MQEIIQNGKRAVSIYSQSPRRYECRLYVNCREGEALTGRPAGLGDATLVTAKFLTLEMAKRWAARKIA